jgi:MFS family permease
MRDFRLLLLIRLLRSFALGFGAIILGLYLATRGFSPLLIGLVITITIILASALALASAAISGRLGRRLTLAGSGLLMMLAGLDLAYATQPVLLILASLTGMLATGSIDQGPFSAVEQALLTESAEPTRRNRAFARYSATGGGASALGALVAGLGTSPDAIHVFWIVYMAIGAITAVIPLLISSNVEGPRQAPIIATFRPLMGLAALLAVDSLGGGFLVRAAVTYWLHIRFGVGVQVLGPAFAAITILATLSYELSGRLADRFGLINTMVFTHLPSNVFLLAVPFSPNLNIALALLILNGALADMDVPARQAYLVSIVKPTERAGAVAFTGAVRSGVGAIGPLLTGLAIQSAAFGLPFLIGGSIKIAYDLALFWRFRHRRADHERKRAGP